MLNAKFVRENLKLVQTALENRGSDIKLDEYPRKYDALRIITLSLDALRAEKKNLSKGGRPTPKDIERAKALSAQIKEQEEAQRHLRDWLEDFLLNLPNIPHESVPVGKSEADNVLVRTWGHKPIWSSEGVLMYDGAGKPVMSRLKLFYHRARAFLRN
jgi:seryl-tRNA synthetase